MINELIKHMINQIDLYNKIIDELDLLERDLCSNFDRKIVNQRKEQIKKLIYDYNTDIEVLKEQE